MTEIDAGSTHARRVPWWERWLWRKISDCFEWLMAFCEDEK